MADPQEIVARVAVLGTFELNDSRGRSLLPRTRKASAILAYLAYHLDRYVARDVLIDLFWSDRDQVQGRASLRQALAEIRDSLGDHTAAIIDVDRYKVRMNGRALAIDLVEAEGTMPDGDPDKLLAGMAPVARVFDDWLEHERRVLAARWVSRAEQAMKRFPEASPEALAAAEAIMRLEPQNETAARIAMKAYAAQDDLSKAVKVFKQLERALQEDGFNVSHETRKVLDALRSGPDLAVQASRPQPRGDGPPMLAILPMPLSGFDAAISQRFTDEMTARMTEVREVRTLGRTLGLRLDRSGEAMLSAAASLGVDYVYGCSVNLVRDVIACIHYLVAVLAGEQIWSLRTRLDPSEPDRSINDTVEALTGAVVAAIENYEWRTRLPRDEESWSAYHHYLHAKSLIALPQNERYMESAEPHLERSLALDPAFSPPYPFLIASYNSARMNTALGIDRADGSRRAFDLARRFLMLDARNPNAHLAMAWCHLRRRQFDMAERSLERAADLGLYDPNRLNAMGTAYVYLGEFEKGEALYRRASELMQHDFDSQQTDMGELFYFRREYAEALPYFRVGELRNPLRPQVLLCATLAQLDRLAEARKEAERLMLGLKHRWRGSEPYSPRAALRWYLDDFVLRRRIDTDNLVEGLTKAGFIL